MGRTEDTVAARRLELLNDQQGGKALTLVPMNSRVRSTTARAAPPPPGLTRARYPTDSPGLRASSRNGTLWIPGKTWDDAEADDRLLDALYGDVDVPVDDSRAIRRAVLDLPAIRSRIQTAGAA